jgi:sporulation protein YlmC with PRC-barrel domain
MENKMKSKFVVAALLSTALMTGVASAQTSTTNTTDRTTLNGAMHRDGEWRSSKLLGLDVYNDAHEKIGNISEMIVDKSGKIENVILGVGGFLGVDEHYVAVAFDKLKWANEPVRTSSTVPARDSTTTVGATNRGDATGTFNQESRPVRAMDEKWYPDHAVYNASKDQLKAMPGFKYN